MECMNVARGDRRKVTDGMRYPFGVASLGNTIYYTDWQRLAPLFHQEYRLSVHLLGVFDPFLIPCTETLVTH